jgi:ATP-dependent Lhr-like helicase
MSASRTKPRKTKALPPASDAPASPLSSFAPPTQHWFSVSFAAPTRAQELGLPPIARGDSTLLLAPTGSGKTLTAFLASLDRLMFGPEPSGASANQQVRVLYVSPLKALAVDIEKNLRAPLLGLAHSARKLGVPSREPTLFVRSGDTPASARRQFQKSGADILITTPESLYLMLTSDVARLLTEVETVIVDEIHVMAGTKRGAHLFLSLERLEALRRSPRPLQRIGLSATVRPLEPVAHALGGMTLSGGAEAKPTPRPVTIVDAGTRRALELSIEVPVRDMKNLTDRDQGPDTAVDRLMAADPDFPAPKRKGASIWPTIYPRMLELIRAHRTTLIFVNNRRLAERLAQAINELAEEELALAHHGSIAHDRRAVIEDRLKRGDVRAIFATSSLELGIDMGSIDLVVQVEAPPTVAAGLQRVGRAGHDVASVSRGIFIPKFRGDLLASATTLRAMLDGEVERTSVVENPLDVLAQQIVAIVSGGPVRVGALFDQVRGAYSFRALPRSAFDGVLDMLSGRYPSHEFAELAPRLNWDRVTDVLSPRRSSRRLAISSGGTIPDRGLFGVFLDGAERPVRIGELDEEMVFESRVGEVFLLGASSWRITEITHDKVLALPAPGEAGKMPFWRGDRASRPFELGLAMGALARDLGAKMGKMVGGKATDAARTLLAERHHMDENSRENLLSLLTEQREKTGELPTDRTIVIEQFYDELGDKRICVLCPFGARVLAPWAMAVRARLLAETTLDVDVITSDDGIVFRIADVEAAPPPLSLIPSPSDVEPLLEQSLGGTALFAARFRENAARSLLLPKKSPAQRMPLWAQRRKASELLAVASNYPSFPLLLETYRECMKDVFDVPALLDVLAKIESRAIKVVVVDTDSPSPLAANLIFSYVASFMYEGDAPLAERRAQALSLDPERLRELLGEVELADLLDEDALLAVDELARGGTRRIRSADHAHDRLLGHGDHTREELGARLEVGVDLGAITEELLRSRRAVFVRIAGQERLIAVEDAAAYRDALGVVPPPGLPQVLLLPVDNALLSLVRRWARTHGPFRVEDVALRWGAVPAEVTAALERLTATGQVVRGRFRRSTSTATGSAAEDEWVDRELLRAIKRKSLAKLRSEVEPVAPEVLSRFTLAHHDVAAAPGSGERRGGRGLEAVLTTIERLEGLALPFSVWLDDVFPARVRAFTPTMLDELCAAGEIVWRGVAPLGDSDGRVAFYLTDRFVQIAEPAKEPPQDASGDLARAVRAVVERRGAVFFPQILEEVHGFPNDVLEAVWDLVFLGHLTNDTTAPLRSRLHGAASSHASSRHSPRFRSRRKALPGSEGRFAPLPGRRPTDATARASALTTLLLERHGVLTREHLQLEDVAGGFSAVYPVLRALEDAGRVRRGYFVEGLGAAQFASASIAERLRSHREPRDPVAADGTLSIEPEAVVLSALDPANLYGSVLPWPSRTGPARGEGSKDRLLRAAGAHVVLIEGQLVGYLARSDQALTTFLPEERHLATARARELATALAAWAEERRRDALQLTQIDGAEAGRAAIAEAFVEVGFVRSGSGLLWRAERSSPGGRAGRRRG